MNSIQLRLSNLICRNVFKVMYKFSHPKAYKHNRRYWPYYQVERNEHGGIDKVYFKNKLISDNSFVPEQNHPKCMLVTTGPSVKSIPTAAFTRTDVDYMGVNGAISLAHTDFKYYVIIDHNFTENRFDLVQKALQRCQVFFTTPRCLDLILRKLDPSEIPCKIRVIEPITDGKIERFMGPRVDANVNYEHFYFDLVQSKGFAKHIHNAVFDYFTVAYVALQIIHQLEYSNIYLAGLDMNNFNQPRFYEQSGNKQPTMLDYYLQDEILPAFETAACFLKQQNVQVHNFSFESAVNAFTKLDPAHF